MECAIMVHVKSAMSTKDLGSIGENIAVEFLKRKGYSIRDRNYRRPTGEIDIIAQKENVVCFVEVKAISRETSEDISREKNDYRPEEQVHPAKLQKIMRTAEYYMAEKGDTREYRIDVVGVFMDIKRKKARCRLLVNVL